MVSGFSFAQSESEIAQNHFNEAIQFSIKGENEKAITAYEKSIAADPNYSDALYNVGALYYNKALELTGAVKSDDPTYANMKKEANENYAHAAKYFEKVIAINPKDAMTLNTLKEIYKTTEEFEKATVVKKKLEALPPAAPDSEKK